MRTVKNEILKAAARSLAHDVIAEHRSGSILHLDLRPPALRPRLVNWITTAPDATVARPEICELAWRHLTVSPIQRTAVYEEACAHHDEGILFRKAAADPLPGSQISTAASGPPKISSSSSSLHCASTVPPELDATPPSRRPSSSYTRCHEKHGPLSRFGMLKALYGSYASKGPR